jgi:hypothetical protein
VETGSREENASKTKGRSSVLIPSESSGFYRIAFAEPRRAASVIDANRNQLRNLLEIRIMKTTLAIFVAALLALAANSPANAKGCIKGAVVGGVAGHVAGHHGVLGAAAGCLYGRHHAKEQERERQRQSQQAPSGQGKM